MYSEHRHEIVETYVFVNNQQLLRDWIDSKHTLKSMGVKCTEEAT